MSVKVEILSELESNKGKSLSGAALAKKLSVSRNAVWKAINELKKEGYRIEAVTNRGYCLSAENDILSEQSITKYLNDDLQWLRLEVHDSVLSTNMLLKQMAEDGEKQGKVIVANEQTMGRGRMGRQFYSPSKSGIYMSILLHPQLKANDSLLITTAAAVAVATAIEKITGKEAKIKWVNDVFCEDKKVCGILTEASMDFESGGLSYVVLGIGINVLDPEGGFPEDLKNIVTSLFGEDEPSSDTRSRLIAEVLIQFFAQYQHLTDKAFMDDYRKRSFVIGKEVDVLTKTTSEKALVLDINDDAQLIVKYPCGTIKTLSSGEVSIRRTSVK